MLKSRVKNRHITNALSLSIVSILEQKHFVRGHLGVVIKLLIRMMMLEELCLVNTMLWVQQQDVL